MAAVTEYAGAKHGGHINRTSRYIARDENWAANVQSFLQEYNNTDVYYTIYDYYGNDKDTCPILAPIYFDVDANDIEKDYVTCMQELYRTVKWLERELAIPEGAIQIYFSGNKGFHVLIDSTILGLQPDKDLNKKLKRVMLRAKKELVLQTIDIRIYDRKRLFRMPNSINSKSGLYKIPLNLNELMGMTYEQLYQLAGSPRFYIFDAPGFIKAAHDKFAEWFKVVSVERRRSHKSYEIPKTPLPLFPCVTHVLEHGVEQGMRNNTTVAVASSLLGAGKSYDETNDILLAWNETCNEPPLPEHEIHAALVSAYSMLKSGRRYGCTAFKELGLCAGRECPRMRASTSAREGLKRRCRNRMNNRQRTLQKKSSSLIRKTRSR